MAVNPANYYEVTFLDRSGEVSRLRVNIAAVADVVTGATAVSDWNLSLSAITEGDIVQRSALFSNRLSGDTVGVGNREDKWLVGCHDSVTNHKFHFTIPTRLHTLLTPTGTDKVTDFSVAPWTLFKSRTEALVLSPDGNACVVDYVQLVGRNI